MRQDEQADPLKLGKEETEDTDVSLLEGGLILLFFGAGKESSTVLFLLSGLHSLRALFWRL